MFKVLACFLIFSVLILILRVENDNLLFAYIHYSLNIFAFLILVFQITINNIINIRFIIITLILIITIQSSNY